MVSPSANRWVIASAMACVFVLGTVWLGVPTYKKWQVDRLVDELCAKDGVVKVYEQVTLPANSFDKFGAVTVMKRYETNSDSPFYYTSETTWILPEGKTLHSLDLYRSHYRLVRASDKKLLAEGVGYTRRGGDPIGPWHSSAYGCSAAADISVLAAKVFVRNTN